MFWNFIWGAVIVLLLISGLFNAISWQISAPLIVVIVVLWLVSVYNSLITHRNRAHEAWSDIEVQLKRRYDLIPNIVNAVKGYVTHEKDTLEKVTEARVTAMGAHSIKEHGQAENVLNNTLKTLFAVSENYPDLKANANFLDLQRELADSENKIQAARRFYNANVRDLNTQIESFPNNLIAQLFRFQKMDFFILAEEAAKEAPKVSF